MTNMDILVMNECAAMYSENENIFAQTCMDEMYDELKGEEG